MLGQPLVQESEIGVEQIEYTLRARVVAGRRIEVAAGGGACGRRRAVMIAVEPIERTAAAFEDRLGVREPAQLAREPLGFFRVEPQPFELVELKAQEVEPRFPLVVLRGDPGELALELVPAFGRLRDLSEQLVVAPEVVDDDPLPIPVEQQVVLVLAVDVDEVLPELAQKLRGHRTVVDERTGSASRTDHAPHDALVRAFLQIPVGEPCPRRCVRGRLEHAADLGPLRAVSNHVGVGPRPEEQGQRVDHDRLARARLSGKRGHPRRAFELQAVDDRERSNGQVREHAGRRLRYSPFPQCSFALRVA